MFLDGHKRPLTGWIRIIAFNLKDTIFANFQNLHFLPKVQLDIGSHGTSGILHQKWTFLANKYLIN